LKISGGILLPRIVKIQFHTADRLYDFNAGILDLKPGERVIVETERGRSIAIVVTAPIEFEDKVVTEGLKPVIRKALPEDIEAAARNTAREKETHAFCVAKIIERNMDMKLVRVEYLFDGSKAIFFFTADGRVDFRELVKDLAHQFHTRIEMRQIGVRDEAKMVGGIGICGRELCCSSFLREFAPVSVKMAKEQSLALNPNKISGQCGRLLCCLGYEYETYCSIRKGLPKCGKHVKCGAVEGEVVKVNILANSFTMKTADSREVVCTTEGMLEGTAPEPLPKEPAVKEPPKQQPARQQSAKQQPAPQKAAEPAPAKQEQRDRHRSGRRRRDRNKEGQNKENREKPKEKP
jgi:cell fate regulator YaaT (PSP1 superfamily)